jgi:cadmium resistance protein CadD (predicted permease)
MLIEFFTVVGGVASIASYIAYIAEQEWKCRILIIGIFCVLLYMLTRVDRYYRAKIRERLEDCAAAKKALEMITLQSNRRSSQ